jgi:RHS repeat-associated protein
LQTTNSWTRDNNSNNFRYNEASELNNTSGLYDLPYRNYDAALGRFFQVDPLAHRDHSTSPFAYAGNNPVMLNDPSGLMINYSDMMARQQEAEQARTDAENNRFQLHFWSRDAGGGGGGSEWVTADWMGSGGSSGPPNPGNMDDLVEYANTLLESGYEGQAYGKDEKGKYGYVYVQSTSMGASSYKDGSTTVLDEFVVTNRVVKTSQAENGLLQQETDYLMAGGPPSYTPPPKDGFPGFPNAERVRPKGGRPRWRLPDGDIIEWDG